MENGYFIYKFVDKSEKVIYIGKTINVKRRINLQHLPLEYKGNLSKECILEIDKIYYHICDSKSDMEIKEKYLIIKLSPKYCGLLNNKDKLNYNIPINWKEFIAKPAKSRKKSNIKDVRVFTLNLKETPHNRLFCLFQDYKLNNKLYSLSLTQFIEKMIIYYVDFLNQNNVYAVAPDEFISNVIVRPGRRPFRDLSNEKTISSNIWLDRNIYYDFLNVTFSHSVRYDVVNIDNYSLSFMTSKLVDFVISNKNQFFKFNRIK